MTPFQALREFEVAAELISFGPQARSNVLKAIRCLAPRVERWRLLYLWKYLQFDAEAEPNRLIGAHQNASALRKIAGDLKVQPLNRVDLAAMVASRKASHPDVGSGRG